MESAENGIAWAAGMRVVARDEVWAVTEVDSAGRDGDRLTVTGVSPLVREQPGVFFTKLDRVVPLRPEGTELVADETPQFRRSRLYWEAVLRATPLPQGEHRLATVGTHLVDDLLYQREPARMALAGLRPRLLIADAVGLGKTLEIGLILSELARRGHGDRILVVTPRHILEQFQHELWTRFAIPLVRLDSQGIQRVRRTIPAGRNPFTYYKRAIISIDTLKSTQYRHMLGTIEWDAVVIDESHKLVNAGSKNNDLVRLLAPRTHALILASATPHNGKKESFGELISLLDPTAVPDPERYEAEQLRGLYIRRHKTSPDVDGEIGDQWKAREQPILIHAKATDPEEAVFKRLYDTWIAPPPGTQPPPVGHGSRLFPYTLLKAFLSSHVALAQTIANRLATLEKTDKAGVLPPVEDTSGPEHHANKAVERQALEELAEDVVKISKADSAKYQELRKVLESLEVGPEKPTRVVIFSERRATLDFLYRELLADLYGVEVQGAKGAKDDKKKSDEGDSVGEASGKDKPEAPTLRYTEGPIRQLHGGLTDLEQQQNVKDFGLAHSDLRILLTGDIAAEGVNLHRECHHLVHYDVPWSLITLEQRNGRIDRYGQLEPPQMRVLLHVRSDKNDKKRQDADLLVSQHLVTRENEVYQTFGDAGAVMRLRSESEEEEKIRDAFLAGRDIETVVALPADSDENFDLFLAQMAGDTTSQADDDRPGGERAAGGIVQRPRLFPDTQSFADAAFDEVYSGDPHSAIGLEYDQHDPELLTFQPAPDLRRRLNVLPEEYLKDHAVLTKMRATFSPRLAKDRLEVARQRSANRHSQALEEAQEGSERGPGRRPGRQQRADSSGWPDVTYLSDQHPVIEWLVDKALTRLARNQAPVVSCAVDEPTVLVQGMFSNAKGRPTVLAYLAVSGLGGADGVHGARCEDMMDVLDRAGILKVQTLYNNAGSVEPTEFAYLVAPAVGVARDELKRLRAEQENALMAPLIEYEERLTAWRRARESKAEQLTLPGLELKVKQKTDKEAAGLQGIMRSLMTHSGEPMIRILGVLVPAANDSGAGV